MQYADARKSYYLEIILEFLQRLESILKQTERNTFCIMPTEKLRNLIIEHQTSYDSIEPYEVLVEYIKNTKKTNNKINIILILIKKQNMVSIFFLIIHSLKNNYFGLYIYRQNYSIVIS